MPLPNTMSARTGADGWPITNSTVSSAASPVWTNVVAISSSLRGTRSASAPPIGPKNAIGRNPAAAIVPVHAAWPVCFVTYTPSASVSIHVPMLDTNAPVHSRA